MKTLSIKTLYFTLAIICISSAGWAQNLWTQNGLIGNSGGPSRTGIGLNNPQTEFHVQATAGVGGANETISRITVSDDPNTILDFRNSTGAAGRFNPTIQGNKFGDGSTPIHFIGSTNPANDAAGSNTPLMRWTARLETGTVPYAGSAPIVNRPLFQWNNQSALMMLMDVNGQLGIGTGAPVSPLHVIGSNGTGVGAVLQSPTLTVVGSGTIANNLHKIAEFRSAASNTNDATIVVRGSRNASLTADVANVELSNFDDNEGAGTEYIMAKITGAMQTAGGQTGCFSIATNEGIGGNGLTEKLFIDNMGNVGIGNTVFSATNSPAFTLDVQGDARIATLPIDNTLTSAVVWDPTTQQLKRNTAGLGGNDHDWYGQASVNAPTAATTPIYRTAQAAVGEDILWTASNKRMEILQNTNFFSNYNESTALLVRNGDATTVDFQNVYGIQSKVSAVVPAGGTYFSGHFEATATGIIPSDSPNNYAGYFYAANGGVNIGGYFDGEQHSIIVPPATGNVGFGTTTPSGAYILDIVGDVNITGTGYITSGSWLVSDKQFKTSVKKMENSLDIIKKLDGVTYAFKDEMKDEFNFPDGKQYGLIAQNVKNVIPELVTDYKEDYLAVNYIGLIPVLIESIKEQQKLIEHQNARLEQLESKTQNRIASSSFNSTEISNVKENFLSQNVPNPFNESTRITYQLPEGTQKAAIGVYNMNGTEMKLIELATTNLNGSIIIEGGNLQAGMYIYSLLVNGELLDSKRMVLTSK